MMKTRFGLRKILHLAACLIFTFVLILVLAGIAGAVSISACGTISVNSELTVNLTSVASTCFHIGANNVVLDCQGNLIDLAVSGILYYGVNNTGFDNVTIKGCRMTDFGIGILFTGGANNGTIRNNTVAASGINNPGYGVSISSSTNTTIINNSLAGTGNDGAAGDGENPGGDGQNAAGVFLSDANGTNVINNRLSAIGGAAGADGGAGAGTAGEAYGLRATTSLGLNITGNTASAVNSAVGSGSNFGIWATGANRSVIEFNKANDTGQQVRLETTSNTTVRGNNVTGTSGAGILLVSSSVFNTLIDNIMNFTTGSGMVLQSSSTHNTLSGNTVTTTSGSGISLSTVHNNTLTSNIATAGSGHAFSVVGANNTLLNNRGFSLSGNGLQASAATRNAFTENNFSSNHSSAVFLTSTSQNNSFVNTTIQANVTWLLATVNSGLNNFTDTVFTRGNGSIRIVPKVIVPTNSNATLAKLNVTADRIRLNSTNLTFLNVSATIVLNLSRQDVTDPFPTVDPEDDGTFVTCSADLCTEQSFANNLFTFNVSHFTGFSFGSASGTLTNLTVSDETDGVVQYTGDTVEFFADYFNGSSGYDILGASCNASFGVDSTTQSMTYNVFIGAYKTTKLYGSAGTTNWNATCAASGFDTLTANDTVTITAIGVPEFSTWTLLIALAGVMVGFFVIRARRGI